MKKDILFGSCALGVLSLCAAGLAIYQANAKHDETPASIAVDTSGMKWIPAGEFAMGTSDDDSQPNERPAHRVRLDGFWIDTHDVTNAEFRRFVQATGYVTVVDMKKYWKIVFPPAF